MLLLMRAQLRVITAQPIFKSACCQMEHALAFEGFVLNLDVAKLGLDETSSSAKTGKRAKRLIGTMATCPG
jgi:hypothetical protein